MRFGFYFLLFLVPRPSIDELIWIMKRISTVKPISNQNENFFLLVFLCWLLVSGKKSSSHHLQMHNPRQSFMLVRFFNAFSLRCIFSRFFLSIFYSNMNWRIQSIKLHIYNIQSSALENFLIKWLKEIAEEKKTAFPS